MEKLAIGLEKISRPQVVKTETNSGKGSRKDYKFTLQDGTRQLVLSVKHGALTSLAADVVVDPANKTRDIRGALSGVLWSNAQKRYKTKTGKDLVDDKGGVWRDDAKKLALGSVHLNTSEFVRITDESGKEMQVIHAVGPDCRNSESLENLTLVYAKCLKIANDNKLKKIAFPAISTGVFQCDKATAGKLAVAAAGDFLRSTSPLYIKEVVFVVYTGDVDLVQTEYLNSYTQAIEQWFNV